MGAGLSENLTESGSYPPLLGKSLVDAWLAVSGPKGKTKGETKVPAKAKAKAKATISMSRAAHSSSDEELVKAKPKSKAKKVQATTKVKAETTISISRAANSSSDEELEKRLRKAKVRATTKVSGCPGVLVSEEEPTKATPKEKTKAQASSGEQPAKIRKSWTTADSDSN